MNPTNSSANNKSPKPQQHFFPQMEKNPPHLYGPSNPNPGWNLYAGGHSSSSVYPRRAAAGPSLCYSPRGISLCSGGPEGSDSNPFCFKKLVVRKRNSARTPAVPTCQVQGCHVSLENAKDYQQKHKVCEMHSKASKAIVAGLDQRFCQRCCRFHVVSEFDGSKRSCRRKLADHNQRRRKSTLDSHVPEKFTAEGALSPLSTTVINWNIDTSAPSDISSRSSAALGDLISENRAPTFSSNLHHNHSINRGQQLPLDYQSDHNYNYHQILADPNTDWERQEGAATLDLLGFLSESRHMNKEDEEEECSVLWNSWNGVNRD